MSEHDFHPIHEGCMKCAALPGEDVGCVPPEGFQMRSAKGRGQTASDYTPDAEEVLETIIFEGFVSGEETKARFDRWLASVKADAFDEGSIAGNRFDIPENPYRGEQA